MKLFRKGLFRYFFSLLLLSTMAVKAGAFLVNHFSSVNDQESVEKNVDEGKEAKENPFEKNGKELLLCTFYNAEQGHLFWILNLPPKVLYHQIEELSVMPRVVPTPPPDLG